MVLGGPEETGQLLEHKFDYIFFTGEWPAAGGRSGRKGLHQPHLEGSCPQP